jgi:hypothetical protein
MICFGSENGKALQIAQVGSEKQARTMGDSVEACDLKNGNGE